MAMSPAEFAEFVKVAKEAGVESFECGDLKVTFKPKAPEAPAFPRRAGPSLTRDDWQFAATEGLPVYDDVAGDDS